MKIWILAIAALGLLPATQTKAQPRKAKQETKGAKGSKSEWHEPAKLPENQGQQVKNLNQAFHERMKAVKNDPNLSKERKHELLQQMNTERCQRIKSITGNDNYNYHGWDEEGFFNDDIDRPGKGPKGMKGPKGDKGEKGEKSKKEKGSKGNH